MLTTNYDDVLLWGREGTEPISNDQEDELSLMDAEASPDAPRLWYLHGTIHRLSTLILGGADYARLYGDGSQQDGRYSLYKSALVRLHEWIRARPFLYVGFSFSDEYVLKQLEHVLGITKGRHVPSFALMKKGSIERGALWPRYNIQLIEYEDHGPPLAAGLEALARAAFGAGDGMNSRDSLEKMVELEPENVVSKIKLAELYARENRTQEAAQEFKKAAEYLKRNNRMDDWFRVAERLSSLDPDNVALARDLAQQYLARGDQKRALARLQVCFKADRRDIETLSMLAQAFHGLGETEKTIVVYKELAKIYKERGRNQDAANIWNRIAELESSGSEARQAPGPGPLRPSAGSLARPWRRGPQGAL
ncbi:SIR2 family protein [Archangium gephyra]|uniref:SIR2 family protein n=1 Tax=Archangium gephyra TaxID=48 RepID=UPI003B789088